MINRRSFIACIALAIPAVPRLAAAHPSGPFELDRAYMPQEVAFTFGYAAGAIVVDTAARFLYLVEEEGRARRYGIGVGRAGLAWSGTAEVGRKAKWPSWTPTPNMIRREPRKYAKFADGVPGGPSNPLGSRALYLYRNGRDTYFRIHGTTEPWTIGKAVSNGCIRLINEHVEDLYERVAVGATVIVLQTKAPSAGRGAHGSS
ncbi:L,D-transpeptidase [Tianweitania sediminis]|uniref:L,D-transpeptidase n=1 Tax=Tianweitania sediminis TaxID=1502156 RepID=A0A8J7RQW9_9HYPH|nr:L,D-transpeptidase [Tianweitania sediminis]MBP0441501.1 L,D-transpeptidase [Tianweitania sediminis]